MPPDARSLLRAAVGREKRKHQEQSPSGPSDRSTANSTSSAEGREEPKRRKGEEEEDARPKPSEDKEDVDEEWQRFQAEVLNSAELQRQNDHAGHRPSLAGDGRATIYADPVPREQVLQRDTEKTDTLGEQDVVSAVKTSDALQDREEFIARLDEEERAQEEAKERVQALKARLERIRQARKSRDEGSRI